MITWGAEDSSDYAQQKILISEIMVEIIIWTYASVIFVLIQFYSSMFIWLHASMIPCFYDSYFMMLCYKAQISIKQDNMILI